MNRSKWRLLGVARGPARLEIQSEGSDLAVSFPHSLSSWARVDKRFVLISIEVLPGKFNGMK